MRNSCQIYKSIINASYLEQGAFGIECCLYLWRTYSPKSQCNHQDFFIEIGMIYLFQDFISRFDKLYNDNHVMTKKCDLDLLLDEVQQILDLRRDHGIVSKQLTLDTSIKTRILRIKALPTKLKESIVSSKFWK